MSGVEGVVERLIYGADQARRHTQDSPVSPDVWLSYWGSPSEPVDLLLKPTTETTSGALSVALRGRLSGSRVAEHEVRIAHTGSHVVACLTFDELLWAALPLSRWWVMDLLVEPGEGLSPKLGAALKRIDPADPWARQLVWLVDLAGLIAVGPAAAAKGSVPSRSRRATALRKLLAGREIRKDMPYEALLDTVSVNRPATPAVYVSRLSIKADAAERVFAPSCSELAWAVIDSGVDAQHPAFRQRGRDGSPLGEPFEQGPDGVAISRTRVEATYDFRRLRDVQASALEPVGTEGSASRRLVGSKEMARTLAAGRLVDWELLSAELAVPHDTRYAAPSYPHGTHVAGILAADWRQGEGLPVAGDVRGICPDLRIYDLRVLDDNGQGSEFAILAALQWVRDFNARSDRMRIHGVNISLSLEHDFRSRACGHTAVCEEASALVASGVVVVAAAGNQGMATFATEDGERQGFRTVAITDPGNADAVITVGATHRSRPHEYGVSHFSSRGPTGDGRLKPDLVAPGEKIEAPFPGGLIGTQDGTSMAAPHVSGAAALLLARHRELIGQPAQIKRLLCETATDLGRERAFQGAGLVDALRALQAI